MMPSPSLPSFGGQAHTLLFPSVLVQILQSIVYIDENGAKIFSLLYGYFLIKVFLVLSPDVDSILVFAF